MTSKFFVRATCRSSSAEATTAVSSTKTAMPWTCSLQSGPCWVASWKACEILSSKSRAESASERSLSATGLSDSLVQLVSKRPYQRRGNINTQPAESALRRSVDQHVRPDPPRSERDNLIHDPCPGVSLLRRRRLERLQQPLSNLPGPHQLDLRLCSVSAILRLAGRRPVLVRTLFLSSPNRVERFDGRAVLDQELRHGGG